LSGGSSDPSGSTNGTDTDPSTEELVQSSLVESVPAPTLSEAVLDRLFAQPHPVDAFPAGMPEAVWEFLALDGDVNFGDLLTSELPGRVLSQRTDAIEVGAPDRWPPSASLAAEGWGLGALLGWSAFLGELLREDEHRRERSRSRRHTFRS
jgi:hypothetical protein